MTVTLSWPCRVHNSAPNVDPMWTRCGLHVASVWILFPHNSAPNVDRCGLDVDSLWIPFPHTSAPNVDRCGLAVDSLWTRFGLLFSIVVRPMWTQTPFSIYNNIGGVSGESTWTPLQHCTGSPWFQMGLGVAEIVFLFALRAQHPGRQLRGALISGPQNSSSRMLF